MEDQLNEKQEPLLNLEVKDNSKAGDQGFSEIHQFLTPKDKLGYAEEHIIVKTGNPNEDELLNYSLSNSLDDIKIAIFARTGKLVNLDKAYWQLNSKLSVSVKHLMNSHHVNYSMTIIGENKERTIVVNMRVADKWFFTDYREFDGEFFGTDFIFRQLSKFYWKYFDDGDDE